MKKILLSLVLCILLISCGNKENKVSKTLIKSEEMSNNIIAHKTIESFEKYDYNNKKLYKANLLLIDDYNQINENDLKTLLDYKYDSIMSVDEKPNFIDIKVYQSEEHLNSNMAQWVAWLSKTINNNEPIITFNTPEEIPSEEIYSDIDKNKRMEIWKEFILSGDRAIKESEAKYPVIDTPEKSDLKYNLEDKLANKYKSELLSKYNITEENLDKIRKEGSKNNWPFPSFK